MSRLASIFPRIAGVALPLLWIVVVLADGGKQPLVWNAAAAVLLGLFAVSLFDPRATAVLTHPSLIPLAACLAWSALAAAFSPVELQSSLTTLVTFTAAFAAAGLLRVGAPRLARRVVWPLAAALALFQTALAQAAPGVSPSLKLFFSANPQYISIWLVAAALCALNGVIEVRKNAQRAALLILLLLMGWGIMGIGSRAGIVAIGVGVGYLLLERFGRRGMLIVGVGGALSVAVFLGPRMADVFKVGNPFAWKRLDIWRTAAAGITEKPVFGWGPGRFEALYHRHALAQPYGPMRYDHETRFAHNDFLQLAAGSGVPAVGFLLWGLWPILRPSRRKVGRPERAFLAALAAFASFNFPLYLPANAMLAGIVAAGVPVRRRRTPYAPVLRWTLASAAGFLALFCAAQGLSLAATRAGHPNLAETLSPWDPEIRVQQADVLLHEGAPSPAKVAEARRQLEEATASSPGNPSPWRDLGHLFADHVHPPDLPAARRAYEEAVTRRPFRATWWLELSEVKGREGNWDGAYEAARRALAIEPFFARAAQHNAALLRERGHLAEAENALSQWLRTPTPPVDLYAYTPSDYAKSVAFVSREPLYLELAHIRLRRDDAAGALDALARARHPDSAEALLLKAGALHQLRRDAEAAALLRRGMAAYPDIPAFRANMGKLGPSGRAALKGGSRSSRIGNPNPGARIEAPRPASGQRGAP